MPSPAASWISRQIRPAAPSSRTSASAGPATSPGIVRRNRHCACTPRRLEPGGRKQEAGGRRNELRSCRLPPDVCLLMRTDVVHDWLNGMRGGEKVLESILPLVPEPTIFTLFHVPGSVSPAIERHPIVASA